MRQLAECLPQPLDQRTLSVAASLRLVVLAQEVGAKTVKTCTDTAHVGAKSVQEPGRKAVLAQEVGPYSKPRYSILYMLY